MLEEKAALLVGIHPTWWYQNAVRMVQRKYQECVDRDTRVEQFVQQQQTALELKQQVQLENKKVAAQEKVLKDLNVQLKKVRDNMDTIAGPLEHKLDWTLDVHLAMRANCYWGLFTGPDIESFFKPYGVLRQEKYFILVEQLGTMLASSDMWHPAAKARGAHMLDQFKDMWTAYSIAYRAVKHTGHQHQERLEFIQEVLPRYCRL